MTDRDVTDTPTDDSRLGGCDPPYRVVIADDEQAMREGLLRWVHWDRAGFSVDATYPDGSDLLRALDFAVPDVILSDIRMTFVSGLEVAQFVYERSLPTRVVLLSAYRDFDYARSAIRYGVVDYLLKPVSARDVERLFRRIADSLDETRRGSPAVPVAPTIGRPAGPICDDDGSRDIRRVIVAAKEFIDTHLSDEVTLDSVAEAVGLSSEYLSRLFKRETGVNYVDYLIGRRIDKAKALLENPTLRVFEVGSAVGYRNQKYFTRLFKSVTGTTPTAYRERRE